MAFRNHGLPFIIHSIIPATSIDYTSIPIRYTITIRDITNNKKNVINAIYRLKPIGNV